MLQRFNKVFGIQESLETERRHFVQRVNQTIFNEVEGIQYPNSYERIFHIICYRLGVNADDRIRRANRMNYNTETIVPSLRTLTGDEFISTLKILVLLYSFFKDDEEQQDKISKWIKVALSNSVVDIGIKWADGMFYPAGAEFLDEQLIEDPFNWLRDYPEEREDLRQAVEFYSKNKLGDVVTNCYLVVEGVVRKILNNRKTLENNKENLLKKTFAFPRVEIISFELYQLRK